MFHVNQKLEEIICNFDDCFSAIPQTGYANKQFTWFTTDLPSNKVFVDYDSQISYKMNSYGYRCDEFVRKEINVMILGCSFTFGNGIPSTNRFGDLFCNKLSVEKNKSVANWNMSWPGCSGDYVARMCMLSIPCLKPDILIVNFPHMARREFFDIDGQLFNYRPDRKVKEFKHKDFMDGYKNLTSHYQDKANLIKNYNLIKSLCLINEVKLLYAIQYSDLDEYNTIRHHFDDSCRGESLKKCDVGRDGGHPGIETNRIHSENFFKTYKNKYD